MGLVSFAFIAIFLILAFCAGTMGIREEDEADRSYQDQDE
jgi:hypothetical protein